MPNIGCNIQDSNSRIYRIRLGTFVVNEVDIDMFASLTSENLTELGINAFGPRKKLLMAISTLNAHRVDRLPHATAKFSGSAAPGAERRQSSDW